MALSHKMRISESISHWKRLLVSFKKEKLLQKIYLCSAVHTYKRGSHRIKCQWLVKHVWMISEGFGRGRRWRCFQTTCDLLHIRNRFMKEKHSWQCRRRERKTKREWLWQNVSSSRHITQQLDHYGPQSFKQTYRDFLHHCFALLMSLNGYRWLQ